MTSREWETDLLAMGTLLLLLADAWENDERVECLDCEMGIWERRQAVRCDWLAPSVERG